MPTRFLSDLRYPALQNLQTPIDRHRVDKHLNDNIARINETFARITDIELTHGTPTLIPNPWGAGASARHPAAFVPADGSTRLVFGAPRTDGFIEVTAQFDLKHTEPYFFDTGGATTVPNNAASPYTTVGFVGGTNRGGVITNPANDGVFRFTETGSYFVEFRFRWQQSVAYTDVEVWFDLNNTGSVITSNGAFWQRANIPATEILTETLTGVIDINSTSTTFRVKAFQTNSVPESRSLLAGASAGNMIRIHRLFNTSTPTQTVSGLLIAS